MKKTHIIAIVLIAVLFGVIVTSLSNNTTYASFREAGRNNSTIYHVVGKLDKKKPYMYDPQLNANRFGFYMVDREGAERRVMLNRPKPDDLESADQIVVIGKAMGSDEFEAKDILMKCPSKYNNGTPEEKKS